MHQPIKIIMQKNENKNEKQADKPEMRTVL